MEAEVKRHRKTTTQDQTAASFPLTRILPLPYFTASQLRLRAVSSDIFDSFYASGVAFA
jgi:hypothetical protein